MGQDKATLKWGTSSLLEHMVQLLSTVATKVRVVGRGELPDKIPGKGPMGGILTGLESTDRDANLFLAVDLPLLAQDFLTLFLARFLATEKLLLACRISGEYPLCLGIRKELLGDLARRAESNELSIRAFIEHSNPDILEEDELRSLGFDVGMFANMNTPQEWRRLQ
jgi:molybdopterin-guanine dinucleotide biosynthesis protein A